MFITVPAFVSATHNKITYVRINMDHVSMYYTDNGDKAVLLDANGQRLLMTNVTTTEIERLLGDA